MNSLWISTVVATVAIAASGGIAYYIQKSLSSRLSRSAREETERLKSLFPEASEWTEVDGAGGLTEAAGRLHLTMTSLKLQADIQGQALARAKLSFNVNVYFSVMAGLVLLSGVGLAIWNADRGGSQLVPVLTSAAGLVTGGLAAMYATLSNASLRHLEGMATDLRTQLRARERLQDAERLIAELADSGQQDAMRVTLIGYLIDSADLSGQKATQPAASSKTAP
jgi:hypothetical protein